MTTTTQEASAAAVPLARAPEVPALPEERITRYRWHDKASSTHRTLPDRLRAWWKLRDRRIRCGRGVIVKPHVEIRMCDNAVLDIGDRVILDNYVFLQLTKPAPVLRLGKHVGIGRYNIIAVKGNTSIGDYTMLGPSCQINDQGHAFTAADLIMNQRAIVKGVTIGRDCWLGAGVKVTMGVTIGDGAVVGAGAVVTKDIPPYEVWAGVPARFVRKRE